MPVDPWEEAAKNFKGAPQGQSAQPSGGAPNEDWKVWQNSGQPQGQAESPSVAQNFQRAFDEMTASKLHSKDQGVMGNLGTGLLNVGKGVLGLATPIFHPLATAKMAADFAGPAPQFSDTARAIIGPFIEHPIESSEQTAGQLLAGKVGGAALGRMSRIGQPYTSPMIPPEEAQALRISKAVQPPVMRNYSQNVQAELPNIRQFAQETGNPMKSQAEMAKAASGAGEKVWKEQYQPLVDRALASTPENLGRLPGEINIPGGMSGPGGKFHVGTLPQIESRLAEINRLTNPAYRAANPSMEASSLERMAELENEAHGLRSVLYDELARANNMDPAQIKAIRESGGRLRSIGEDTQQAIEDRAKKVGRSSEGAVVPFSKSGLIDRTVEFLRGGREAMADANLRKALAPQTTGPIRMGLRAPESLPPAGKALYPLTTMSKKKEQ